MKDYPTYDQHFEVVLMKKGVTEDAATPDDFKRVAVVAKDQVAAMMSDEVTAAAGEEFRAVVATPPGVPTGFEQMARRRMLNAGDQRTTNW